MFLVSLASCEFLHIRLIACLNFNIYCKGEKLCLYTHITPKSKPISRSLLRLAAWKKILLRVDIPVGELERSESLRGMPSGPPLPPPPPPPPRHRPPSSCWWSWWRRRPPRHSPRLRCHCRGGGGSPAERRTTPARSPRCWHCLILCLLHSLETTNMYFVTNFVVTVTLVFDEYLARFIESWHYGL